MITTDTGPGGLARLTIVNPQATAEIFLHGGQVTRWQPTGERPVLWMSGSSLYADGRAIRGGIPICFPWFGPHPTDVALGAHGFARLKPWTVERTVDLPDGRSRVKLSLATDASTRTVWPHHARLSLAVTVGKTLEVELTVSNTGTAPFIYAEALHTYFAVGDIHRTEVHGLAGASYLDKIDPGRRIQEGPVTFSGETDRIYDSAASAVVVDRAWGRRITVHKSGSGSTVVWNPWITKSIKMPDFGDEEWKGMVCVEAANVGDGVVVVPPSFSHHLQMSATLAAL